MEEEEVKMQNIDIRQFETVQTLNDADYIVLSLGGGSSAKIMAGLMKNLLSAHIRPNVKDGYWYVGATNTNVVATGRTPEMRKGALGIEYKYTDEDDSAWRLLVPYSDIKLQFDALSEAQKAEVYEGVSAQIKDEVIEDVNKATESANTAAQRAEDAAKKAEVYADRVKDITEAEWEEMEANKTWVEGVEYNVYEV